MYCPVADLADLHPLDVPHRIASENHTDTEIWQLQLLEEEEVVVEVEEGGEVPMMETTIALVPREMLRPETGATARGAEVRVAGVPAGVVAGVQLAVLHPGEEEEVPEEAVEAVEETADVEAQAIAAMARAAGAEAETADAETLVDVQKIWEHKKSCICKFLVRHRKATDSTQSIGYTKAASDQTRSCLELCPMRNAVDARKTCFHKHDPSLDDHVPANPRRMDGSLP